VPFSEVLNITLPTFFTIIIGYIVGKTFKISITGIIDVVFYIGLPALAFVSILSKQIVLLDAVKVWAAYLMGVIACCAIAWLVFKIKREKHSGLYLPIFSPNTVNVPFPIISLAYGSPGLLVATLYYIPNVVFLYSLGIFIVAAKSWRENLKETFKVPTIYTATLALLLNLFHVKVPELVMSPLSFISGMVVPLVLFTLGFNLSSIKVTSIPTTLLASFIRLGVGLGIGILAVYLFNLTGINRSVVILMSSMPAAVNTYVLAAKYKNEPDLVASVVLVTTVASLLMIPFLLNILG
jgi:predicted permease